MSIKAHEPCQVRKEAAISGNFYVIIVFHREVRKLNIISYYFFSRGDIMSYTALYRKYRPKTFEEVVGQEHITRTLRNQIISGRVGHAYLLNGGRGTGKTSTAKILARAINCLNPQDGNPCNECEICKSALNGSLTDIVEMDAASNNSVEDIRAIRDEVNFLPTAAKYRVYIIDEVHMLSIGAFNALLKTLEEPPAHVKFILATTEPQKLPATILSRCQRFDFKRIKPSDIILRMKEIAHGDKLNISEDAYELLGRLADGSMRDGLSILERVVSACGNSITAKNITATLGISTAESIFQITDAIEKGDVNKIISVIDNVMSDGKDLRVFIDSLIKNFRDMLICKITEDSSAMLDYNAEDMVKLKALSDKMSFEKISHATSVLSDAQADTKWMKSPRIVYELALIKLARPEYDDSPSAVMDRLASLESKVKNGAVTDTSSLSERISNLEEKVKNGITVQPTETVKKKEVTEKKKTSVRLYNPIPKEELTSDNPIVKVAKNWDNISRTMCNSAGYLKAALMNRNITIDSDGIILLFNPKEKGAYNIAAAYKDKMQVIFKRASGTDFAVKVAYENDIQEELVDFWNLPGGNGEVNEPTKVSDDPLDNLVANFGEIVENVDESEFMEYDSSKDNFSQSSLDDNNDEDDDNAPEEFLEGKELSPEDDNN